MVSDASHDRAYGILESDIPDGEICRLDFVGEEESSVATSDDDGVCPRDVHCLIH